MGQDDQDRKGEDSDERAAVNRFNTLKSQDARNERRIFWYELAIIHVTGLLVTVYLVASLISLGILSVPLP